MRGGVTRGSQKGESKKGVKKGSQKRESKKGVKKEETIITITITVVCVKRMPLLEWKGNGTEFEHVRERAGFSMLDDYCHFAEPLERIYYRYRCGTADQQGLRCPIYPTAESMRYYCQAFCETDKACLGFDFQDTGNRIDEWGDECSFYTVLDALRVAKSSEILTAVQSVFANYKDDASSRLWYSYGSKLEWAGESPLSFIGSAATAPVTRYSFCFVNQARVDAVNVFRNIAGDSGVIASEDGFRMLLIVLGSTVGLLLIILLLHKCSRAGRVAPSRPEGNAHY